MCRCCATARCIGVVKVDVDQTDQKRARRALRCAIVALTVAAGAGGARGHRHRALVASDCVRSAAPRSGVRYLAQHDLLSGALNRVEPQRRTGSVQPGAPRRAGPDLRCCAWTSTASRKSTMASATPPATRCCARWRSACDALLRHGDHVARLGGDEFAILQSGVSGPARRERRWRSAWSRRWRAPYEFEGTPVHLRRQRRRCDLRRRQQAGRRAAAQGRPGAVPRQEPMAAAASASTRRNWTSSCTSAASWCATSRVAIESGDDGAALPAAVRRRWRHADRLRGAGALARIRRAATCRRPSSFRWPRRPA